MTSAPGGKGFWLLSRQLGCIVRRRPSDIQLHRAWLDAFSLANLLNFKHIYMKPLGFSPPWLGSRGSAQVPRRRYSASLKAFHLRLETYTSTLLPSPWTHFHLAHSMATCRFTRSSFCLSAASPGYDAWWIMNLACSFLGSHDHRCCCSFNLNSW